MSNILQNDFSAGIISPKLIGKYNSGIYQNSCFLLENFSIIPQGGVTRRPGTSLKNNPLHSQTEARTSLVGTRLVPFGIDETHNYVLEFGNETVRVWNQDCNSLMSIWINGTAYTTLTTALVGFSLYTTAELESIQYTQDYERLYIAHRNHKPMVVKYTVKTIGGEPTVQLEFSQLTPTLQTNDTDNVGLFTGDECPGVVMYYASRLWFASSNNHPYRIWASRPFVFNNFEFWDIEQVVDDGVTAETIENAIKYGAITVTSDIEVSLDEDTWNSRGLPSRDPYTFVFQSDAWKLDGQTVDITSYGFTIIGSPSPGVAIRVRYFNINEVTYTDENVYREDSALLLEVGSNHNDSILWMNSMSNYIVVGTTSGEWLMPGTINGLTQNAYQTSAFGSIRVQAVQAGNDLVFAQSKHKIRAMSGSSDGFSCPDLTFYSTFPETVKRMVWQRVPEPRLYCLTNDGKIRVLFYDRLYNLQGWALWTFNGLVKDVCVIESSSGQTLYAVIQRVENNTIRLNLEAFDEADVLDHVEVCDCKYGIDQSFHCIEFNSLLMTNAFDTSVGKGSTMGNLKRVYRAIARVLNTAVITAGYSYVPGKEMDGRYDQTRAAKDEYIDDIEITIPGGYEKFISVGFKSSGRNTMTILALSMNTEVS